MDTPSSRTRLAVLLSLLYLAVSVPTPAPAQTQADTAAIVGHLLAHQTHEPIIKGVVAVVGTHVAATTDSLGRFRLSGLTPGTVVLQISAVGYATGSWGIALQPREVLQREFDLELLPYELPEVVVKGRTPLAERRFADFERRRHSGMGYFITQEQIERSGAATLVDLLARVRGVEQICISNDCVAKMIRSPPGCYPQYFLDGVESKPYFARNTLPEDIKGIEIYRGASETPGEFIGSNSGCGVIAIWTKSSP
jgi:hypothetical protein